MNSEQWRLSVYTPGREIFSAKLDMPPKKRCNGIQLNKEIKQTNNRRVSPVKQENLEFSEDR